MHSDIVFRWYQGGRKVSSWTNQRGGKMTTAISQHDGEAYSLRLLFPCRGIDKLRLCKYLDPKIRNEEIERYRVVERSRPYDIEFAEIVFIRVIQLLVNQYSSRILHHAKQQHRTANELVSQYAIACQTWQQFPTH